MKYSVIVTHFAVPILHDNRRRDNEAGVRATACTRTKPMLPLLIIVAVFFIAVIAILIRVLAFISTWKEKKMKGGN